MIPSTRLFALFAMLTATLLSPASANPARTPAQEPSRPAASVRNFVLITQQASGWRRYAARKAPVFKAGEPIQFYAEPVALGWSGASGRGFKFELHIDAEIRTLDGRTVWGQRDFGRLARDSEAADPNTYITGAVAVQGLTPGVYVLAIRLRDPSNQRFAETETAFAILAEPRRIDA